MAPIPRPLQPPTPQHKPRQGGVLLLLYPGIEGDLSLVLTRRSDIVANHRGQISLPGGAVDNSNPNGGAAGTALLDIDNLDIGGLGGSVAVDATVGINGRCTMTGFTADSIVIIDDQR